MPCHILFLTNKLFISLKKKEKKKKHWVPLFDRQQLLVIMSCDQSCSRFVTCPECTAPLTMISVHNGWLDGWMSCDHFASLLTLIPGIQCFHHCLYKWSQIHSHDRHKALMYQVKFVPINYETLNGQHGANCFVIKYTNCNIIYSFTDTRLHKWKPFTVLSLLYGMDVDWMG